MPFRPMVPSPSATFLMPTPSCPAIAVAMRVDKLSLSEKFGLLRIACKSKVDVDGVVVIFEKTDHGVARHAP